MPAPYSSAAVDLDAQPTPNPNSLKLVRRDGRPFLPGGEMRSFTSFADAAADPLGIALFAVPGVAGVFVLPAFLTVTKTAEASWDNVLPAVEAALRDVTGDA